MVNPLGHCWEFNQPEPYFQCVKETFLCKESVLTQYNHFLSNPEFSLVKLIL